MKYSDIRSNLGRLAHESATQQYKARRRGQHIIYHNVLGIPIAGGFREVSLRGWGRGTLAAQPIARKDLDDAYLAWLIIALQTKASGATFPLETADAGYSRQPDLACIELHEVYEVKPNTPSQRAAGNQQLVEFRNLLQMGDADYLSNSSRYRSRLYPQLKGKMWQNGTQFVPTPAKFTLPPLGTVSVSYLLASAGLIVWETQAEQKEVREKANNIAKDTLRVAPLPQTEESATSRADDILARDRSLARVISSFVMAVGAIVAILALAAALASFAPAGIAAVVGAFALCLVVNSQQRPVVPRLG